MIVGLYDTRSPASVARAAPGWKASPRAVAALPAPSRLVRPGRMGIVVSAAGCSSSIRSSIGSGVIARARASTVSSFSLSSIVGVARAAAFFGGLPLRFPDGVKFTNFGGFEADFGLGVFTGVTATAAAAGAGAGPGTGAAADVGAGGDAAATGAGASRLSAAMASSAAFSAGRRRGVEARSLLGFATLPSRTAPLGSLLGVRRTGVERVEECREVLRRGGGGGRTSSPCRRPTSRSACGRGHWTGAPRPRAWCARTSGVPCLRGRRASITMSGSSTE